VSERALEIRIGLRTLVVGALVVGLAAAVIAIKETLLMVFLGLFLALVLELPVRETMRRTGMSRGKAATVVVLGIALVLTVLLLLFLVPIVGAVRDFLHSLPDLVAELRESGELSWVGDSSIGEDAQQGAESVSSFVPDAISAVLGVAGDAFSVLLAVSTLFFLTLFLLIDMSRLRGAVGSVLMPDDADRWLPVWERVTRTVSRWAIGAIVVATIAGTVQGGTALLLGSSYWLALAFIAGALDLIPMIGATIAGFILVPTVLAEEGVVDAVIMLVVILVYQQLENNVVNPAIQGKASEISPFFVILGVTIGSALLGVLGALVAVPVTASLQIVVREVSKARQATVREAYAADPRGRVLPSAFDELAEAEP
jgi:predicted PurR-regulated permease PerM